MMGQRFRGGIRKVVEFVGRIAVEDTDRVRAGFDILKEKEVKIEGGGPRVSMGVVKEICKGYVARGST